MGCSCKLTAKLCGSVRFFVAGQRLEQVSTIVASDDLCLISIATGERHGYGIVQDIQERGDTAVPDVGTMCRGLARMVEHRLIEAAARRRAPGLSTVKARPSPSLHPHIAPPGSMR